MKANFIFACLIALTMVGPTWGEPQVVRLWTDVNGRTLEGELELVTTEQVKVKLKQGGTVVLPLSSLSQADKDFVAQNKGLADKPANAPTPQTSTKPLAVVNLPAGSKWPDRVLLKELPEITVVSEDDAKSEYVYQSPHYEFRSPKRLGGAVVKEFARLFEVTYQANCALPLDFKPTPEKGRERFLCMIYETYADYLKAGGVSGSGGVYLAGKGFIAVPLQSLGVKFFGKKLVLERGEDNDTLIHEITHQMMNRWLGRFPTWYVEGSAEFVRMAKYERGNMFFTNPDKLFQEFLMARGSDGKSYTMVNLQKLMTMDGKTWAAALVAKGGAGKNYASAGALTYYFYLCDDKGDGQHMIDFVAAVGRGESHIKAMTQHLLRDRTYAQLQEDVEKGLRRKGMKITWTPGTEATAAK
jgi:hypothetical protein